MAGVWILPDFGILLKFSGVLLENGVKILRLLKILVSIC